MSAYHKLLEESLNTTYQPSKISIDMLPRPRKV